MQTWIIVTAVVLPVTLVLVFLIVILRCFSSKRERKEFTETTRIRSVESLQSGIAKLQTNHKNSASIHHHQHDIDNKRKVNYNVLRRGSSMRPFFDWSDHPSLVLEAVEHGWSRFAFKGRNMSSPSTRSALLALCVPVDLGRESEAEISWEVCAGSVEYMQKVRLNSGLRKAIVGSTPLFGVSSVVQTALPLPGPFLGNSSFPQEAFFEITTLSSREDGARNVSKGEGEKTKLIQEVANANAQSDELKIAIKDEGRSEAVSMCLGLTVGGSFLRNSLAPILDQLDSMRTVLFILTVRIKLVFENEKAEWESTDRVIGCGFNPSQKKIFFTIDSELVHVIHCKSDEFGSPLYPTLAANIDITVVVNFGQRSFKYAPANSHRTTNPCFIRSVTNGHTATLGYEDSKELFSMGRIDAEWLNRCTTKSSHSTINNDNRNVEIDVESETDLFEIVLDNMKRSPSTFR
ncbi:hypothetical protein IFM89_024553 [Coptis chinensis]|uniref:SPRY domain-containing protein n=1 Tax=Coptis chinensis TaxID=261450 RepID=A0A835M9P8_9MAGN|nr:hypothetical protein IFM89_024553 [Coptis chinensis]